MARNTTRIAGATPGALSWVLVAAGTAGIALLTGSPAALVVLVAMLVVMVAAAIDGYVALRSVAVITIDVPATVTAGETFAVRVRQNGSRPTVRRIELFDGAQPVGEHTGDSSAAVNVDAVIFERGVVNELRWVLTSTGRLGMVAWRRRGTCAVGPLTVAAPFTAERVPTIPDDDPTTCGVAARSIAGDGDPDTVRPWADGDTAAMVSWRVSLRAGQIHTFERAVQTAQRVVVSAEPQGDADIQASTVRSTLHAALDNGCRVAVRTGADERTFHDHHDLAVWSATFRAAAGRRSPRSATNSRPSSPWARHVRLTVDELSEGTARIGWLPRVALALATTLPTVMLLRTLQTSPTGIAATVVGAMIAVVVSMHRGHRGHRSLVQLGGLITGGAVIAATIDVSGAATPLGALRGIFPQVLAGLVVVHGFDSGEHRGARVGCALAGFLTAYAAALRVDGGLMWWMIAIAVPLAVAITQFDVPDAVGSGGGGRARATLIRPFVGLAVVGAVALAALQFVSIPRGPAQLTSPSWIEDRRPASSDGSLTTADGADDGDASNEGNEGNGGGGNNSSAGSYPGFTDSLDTSSRGNLGDEVVLRVRAAQPDFWRGQVFATYDGRSWFPDDHDGYRSDGPTVNVGPTFGDLPLNSPWELHDFTANVALSGPTLVQTFYPQVDLPNLLFGAPNPQTVLIDAAVWQRPDGGLRADVTLTAGSAYTVVSRRANATPASLGAEGDVSTSAPGLDTPLDAYLQLPDTVTDRTRQLAGELAASTSTTYDFVRATEAWLAANVEYRLDAPVPPAGTDAVDYFLFDSQLGFCEHIASALTIMLRSQGVPARVATGYVPSERDEMAGVWISRARDAHAWVEVYFPDHGWVAFDPTADVPLSGESAPPSLGRELATALADWVVRDIDQLLVGAVAAVSLWGLVIVGRRRRYRRERGTWGLTQDRFSALGAQHGATGNDSNQAVARRLGHPRAIEVAAALDRQAFGPGRGAAETGAAMSDDALRRQVETWIDELAASVTRRGRA